jgi:UDP-2,3-diacylglucosamine hydrolase
MGKAYFISDAHLGLGPRHEERVKEDRLLAFLNHIKSDAEHLFILGDLFDAWLEYRTVIPKGFHRILAKLDELSHSGVKVHFHPGNHDCWIRDYFRDEIGMTIHTDPFETVIHNKRIFLHHGDGLANNDVGYTILKKIVRHPFSIWLYSWLHPDLGLKIARSSSRTSRQYTQQKHYGEEDGMRRFAENKIDAGYDIVIMGHRHQPLNYPINNGIYINLGDWISHFTYAVLDEQHITLNKWES